LCRRREFLRAGFTITEILVSVSVIALLLALAAPGVAGAQANARATQSAGNLRQLLIMLDQYVTEQRDVYPSVIVGRYYFTDQPELYVVPTYWQSTRVWPSMINMASQFRDTRSVFLSPGSPRLRDEYGWPTSYEYSHSFVAQPATWQPQATPDPGYLKPVRRSQVAFPSSKAVMWDAEVSYIRRELRMQGVDIAEPIPMGMGDGSSHQRSPASARDATESPFLDENDHWQKRLHNTTNGVAGVDY
jgi:prepilin-type N-terminal cleavage/methylation domain-containing protein